MSSLVRSRRLSTVATPVALLVASAVLPHSIQQQILGAVLVVAGEAIRLWAAGCVDKNQQLATDGPYAWTRNPLYLGSFIIAGGYGLLAGLGIATIGLAVVFALFYRPTILEEEQALRAHFGALADEYYARVPRFLPRWPRRWSRGPFSWRRAARNREWEAAIANAVAVTIFWLT